MKRNVDLTEHGIFTTSSSFESVLFKTVVFPWEIRNFTDIPDDFTLFPVGDKEQRESYKLTQQELSGEYCHRCGCKIKHFPNLHFSSLCAQCNRELEVEVNGRTPWSSIPEEEKQHRGHFTFYNLLP